MCMAFLLFFVFSSTVFSFQICAWYLFPHCSYPSPFHWFNLFTITYIYLCAGYFSYWSFIILLFAYLILMHGISLHFLFNSTSLHFISWLSHYLLLNSTAYLFQIISANNIPLTFCSSFCNLYWISPYDRSVYLYIKHTLPHLFTITYIYSLSMTSPLYSFLNPLCFIVFHFWEWHFSYFPSHSYMIDFVSWHDMYLVFPSHFHSF